VDGWTGKQPDSEVAARFEFPKRAVFLGAVLAESRQGKAALRVRRADGKIAG
jgi:hypothetical protein